VIERSSTYRRKAAAWPHQCLVDISDMAAQGGSPNAALIQGNDGNFYGTSVSGGLDNQGVLFKVTPTGVETVLYYFLGAPDGKNPGALN
jgi:uncharacterized repeat protein (TIGR03803 family)